MGQLVRVSVCQALGAKSSKNRKVPQGPVVVGEERLLRG